MATVDSVGFTGFKALLARAMPGIAGGLIGGLAFGIVMHVEGMLPMVAMMVNSEAVVVGWIVHLIISIGLGVTFAFIFGSAVKSFVHGLAFGAMWGVIWWVLGALILMPIFLGMSEMVLTIDTMQWKSLMGHMIFGLVMGAVIALVAPKCHSKLRQSNS
ncbi:hypothetical protein [Natronoglycomyces albus]|uniref:DUF1440 domain-containing protein n=1 Tax=Natronoglycomyces albus TaxID=2811108 RepID=A0A895XFP7_9ACTN|nr:hypothetical protein [Natronoglycomyces albus]QSB04671.1 hypothetical protein JQS30_12945 [Natronoglycomyces albus]